MNLTPIADKQVLRDYVYNFVESLPVIKELEKQKTELQKQIDHEYIKQYVAVFSKKDLEILRKYDEIDERPSRLGIYCKIPWRGYLEYTTEELAPFRFKNDHSSSFRDKIDYSKMEISRYYRIRDNLKEELMANKVLYSGFLQHVETEEELLELWPQGYHYMKKELRTENLTRHTAPEYRAKKLKENQKALAAGVSNAY